MIFKATSNQLQNVCAHAVNHSVPEGRGFLHYRNERYFAKDFFVQENRPVHIDYYRGRMVKLHIHPIRKDLYEIRPYDFRKTHQSWARHFNSLREFLESAGITEYDKQITTIAN